MDMFKGLEYSGEEIRKYLELKGYEEHTTEVALYYDSCPYGKGYYEFDRNVIINRWCKRGESLPELPEEYYNYLDLNYDKKITEYEMYNIFQREFSKDLMKIVINNLK